MKFGGAELSTGSMVRKAEALTAVGDLIETQKAHLAVFQIQNFDGKEQLDD